MATPLGLPEEEACALEGLRGGDLRKMLRHACTNAKHYS
jgi:hypothetical protein